MDKNKKQIIIISVAIVLIIVVTILVIVLNNNKKKREAANESRAQAVTEKVESTPELPKLDIIDLNSKTRPIAIVINNTPVAVKVQQGLNNAFLVYEFPTEGATSRLMALFKDSGDVKIGTIRSARHNFIDMALESNAIFCAYGWSHYAKDDLTKNSIDYVQGIAESTETYWRENPENLALEHTMYSSVGKLQDFAKTKGYKLEAATAESTYPVAYSAENVDLSTKDGAQAANHVTVLYGGYGNVTEFDYDAENKIYNRYSGGNPNTDHETGEVFNCKNIIVEKITYSPTDDNKYWNLNLVASGEGYFITNGYSVPITWSKDKRSSKTKYKYADGTEVKLNDGRTYIEIQPTDKATTIE